MTDQLDSSQRARSAELLRALTDSVDAAQDDQKALRHAVCAYIGGQKGRKLTVEEITETVRSILANADSRSITPTFGGAERVQAHAKDLVDWCVMNVQRRVDTTA